MSRRLPYIRSFRIVIPLAASVLLGGCQTWNRSSLPDPKLDAAAEFGGAYTLNSGAVQDQWLMSFGSPALEAFANEALESNPLLGASAASLDAALASSRISGANLWPSLTGSLNGRRSLSNTATGGDVYSTSTNASLGVSWEIDLWGKLRNSRRAATRDYVAAEADYVGARLSLVANVARLWIDNIAARQQLDLAERTLLAFEENQAVIQGRFERGLSNALDLQLIRTSTEGARSAVASRKEQLSGSRRSLELSLGRYPRGALVVEEGFPEIGDSIPVGMPIALLERRPDLLAAQARLDARAERTLVAQKNRLPSLDLSGSIGRSARSFDDLGDSDFDVWSIFGGLSAPIFNFGRLEAEQDRALAQYDEAVMNYVNTALRAFNEVEGLLAGEVYLDERLEAGIAAETAADEAERISWERYRSGLVDIVTVLDSQRRADNARRDVIALRAQRLQNRIDLHAALGGDFE